MKKIAIIGMGCLFPKAPNLSQYYQLLFEGKNAIQNISHQRWPAFYYQPSTQRVDRFYSNQAACVDEYSYFDALQFKTMPNVIHGTEPDQLLGLQVVSQALEDAGYWKRNFHREKTSVILGRGAYIGAGMSQLNQRIRASNEIIKILEQVAPHLDDKKLDQLYQAFNAPLAPYGPDTAIGVVPNLCASRISNRLNLGGSAYTIDAACASSLVALSHACDELQLGKSDLAIAGGVHLVQDMTFWSVFCQLGALSKRGKIEPFSANADGLVIGEGLGVVVLKRWDDALRDGDRIYAVIQGIGISSDGQGASLMSPSQQGQKLALQRAWEEVGLSEIKNLSILEGHGTGTAIGDQTEIQSMLSFFEPHLNTPIPLGSVKSQIGHTMPSAGIASVIKTTLALYHGLSFPTLGAQQPHPLIHQSPFYLPTQTSALNGKWGAVNAFGFGGINAHLILQNAKDFREQSSGHVEINDKIHLKLKEEEYLQLLWVCANSIEALKTSIEQAFQEPRLPLQRIKVVGQGKYRLAIHQPNAHKKELVLKALSLNKNINGKDGIYLNLHPEEDLGQVAFLYPGIEATFAPNIDDLAVFFQQSIPTLYKDQSGLAQQSVGVIRLNQLMTQILNALGIKADHIAGHSIGEWSGMLSAGVIDHQRLEPFIEELSHQTLDVPDVSFLAIGTSFDKAQEILDQIPIECSHQNCPHQVIYCGPDQEIDLAIEKLNQAKILCQKLPFKSGFHASFFKPYQEKITQYFEKLAFEPSQIPFWSATTTARYPQDMDEFKVLCARHLVEKVNFEKLILRLYEEGVRCFIQVGHGSLSSFVADTLRGKKYLSLECIHEKKSALPHFLGILSQLWVWGYHIDPQALIRKTDISDQSVRLNLSVPFADLSAMKSEKKSNTTIPSLNAQYEGECEWTLSIDHYPYLKDHCFFRQPPNRVLEEFFPVVPMTLSLEWLIGIAQQLHPKAHVVGIEKIKALKWLEIEPKQQVKIKAKFLNPYQLKLEINGYFQGVILFQHQPLLAPTLSYVPQEAEESAPITASQIYQDRWMFHGPSYQCIKQIDGISPSGIRGKIIANGIPGALLDNVGQLFGLWLMLKEKVNRVMMPLQIDKILFYGPPPAYGTVLDCQVWIDKMDQKQVQCHACLWYGGKVWATFEQWVDWRFETSDRLWHLMQWPEKNLYSTVLKQNKNWAITWADQVSSVASSREFLVGRCLSINEKRFYRSLALASQQNYLAGRIAAKDAWRSLSWQEKGKFDLFPIEVEVALQQNAKPNYINQPHALSISHKKDIGVALCVQIPIKGCGIDIEYIEPKAKSWVDLVLSTHEQSIIASSGLESMDRDVVLTMIWSAKESVVKALSSEMRNPLHWALVQIRQDQDEVIIHIKPKEQNDVFEIRALIHQGYVVSYCLI